MMRRVRPWAQTLSALGLLVLLAACGMSQGARAALDAGLQAREQGALREALEHFRSATRLAPDSAAAQLALGERERNYLDAQFGRDARQGPTPCSVR